MSNVAIIPARSGSVGIKNKNLMKVGGSTLLELAVKEAVEANSIDSVIVTTDSQYYADLAKSYGAEVPFLRPAEFSTSNATAVDVMRHAISELAKVVDFKIDRVAYLQPTSPFRLSSDIDNTIELLNKFDDVVSVVEAPHNMLPQSIMVKQYDGCVTHYIQDDDRTYLRQKKVQNIVARNGPAIYAVWADFIRNSLPYSGRTGYYQMSKMRSLDIDDEFDLFMAKQIVKLLK